MRRILLTLVVFFFFFFFLLEESLTVTQSHGAVLQKRLEVLVAARKQRVGVRSCQAAAPLQFLAHLGPRCRPFRDEQSHDEGCQHCASAQQEGRAWYHYPLPNKSENTERVAMTSVKCSMFLHTNVGTGSLKHYLPQLRTPTETRDVWR